jgi:hypothetical protein
VNRLPGNPSTTTSIGPNVTVTPPVPEVGSVRRGGDPRLAPLG